MSRTLIKFIAALAASVCPLAPPSALAQERVHEVYACKVGRCAGHPPPVAVTGVRNLQNGQWWRDLEVEVKNVSDKPIYYIRFGVSLPETGAAGGFGLWGVFLRYGRPALVDIRLRAEAGDVPLKPGESHVFKIPEGGQATFSGQPEAVTRRVLLRVDTVNFGDGTGVVAGGVPVSRRRP